MPPHLWAVYSSEKMGKISQEVLAQRITLFRHLDLTEKKRIYLP